MKTLRYRSRGQEVYFLEEILEKLGYNVYVSNYFGKDSHAAIIDFQKKNKLVADGIVGLKTWSKLIEKEKELIVFNDKLLSEKDIEDFATTYDLEVAVVKAVNEIESSGKGFLVYGRPRILFEGHVFWKQLKSKGLNPSDFLEDRTKDVLYSRWTKKYYKGGAGEYTRLEKAAGMSDLPEVHDAAYASASWGAFQIMGYHYKKLGYASVDHFVSEMYEHEREHLAAFGKFIKVTVFKGKPLLDWARAKNWAKFAEGYNGSGYRQNKYDEKLQKAYLRYAGF
ncbi:N-acetylmuramidase domain-containing protein [Aquimarina agarilytica]|uniref:N-acetylmuramidase domain-containing protein n=1 Tax=Aquimarina agarilytica TaxID=1087449 RepID=UPI00028863A6|nr:N-acetylmuramidase family protein [Aquimarina agarilytica]